MRAVFALTGLAALAWGGWLALEFALGSRNAVQALFWFAGGPLVHDLVVAPAVGLLGLALVRVVPVAWRAPVAVGAVVSAVLALLAVPLLWRPFGVATNPGLHDADYLPRLAVTLGVVWVAVLLTGLARRRRRGSPPPP
ncbi:hypothetical protein [Actinophytocola sediminis]